MLHVTVLHRVLRRQRSEDEAGHPAQVDLGTAVRLLQDGLLQQVLQPLAEGVVRRGRVLARERDVDAEEAAGRVRVVAHRREASGVRVARSEQQRPRRQSVSVMASSVTRLFARSTATPVASQATSKNQGLQEADVR